MKKKILFLSCFFLELIAVAQENQQFKQLQIGDKLESWIPLKLLNSDVANKQIGEYRDKWLILDFWATYCQPCLNAVPKLNNLQEKFKDNLNIVMVNSEKNEEGIKQFFFKNPMLKNSKIPSVFGDSILKKLFPHKIIPHEVWISPKGVVMAITSEEELTELNIQNMMAETKVNLKTKQDKLNWSMNSEKDSSIIYTSKLEKYLRGIPSGVKFNKNGNNQFYNRVYFFNSDPIHMFYDTFSYLGEGILGNINEKRIILDIRDSIIYQQYTFKMNSIVPSYNAHFPYMQWENYDEWKKANLFSYEMVLPKSIHKDEFRRYVFSDLNRLFPIKGRVEKRKVFCWMLKSNSQTRNKLITKGGLSNTILTKNQLGVNNKPIGEFLKLLAMSPSMSPIIDESNINYPIDILIDFTSSIVLNNKNGLVVNSPIDMDILTKYLKDVGVELKPTKRFIDMLIISDY